MTSPGSSTSTVPARPTRPAPSPRRRAQLVAADVVLDGGQRSGGLGDRHLPGSGDEHRGRPTNPATASTGCRRSSRPPSPSSRSSPTTSPTTGPTTRPCWPTAATANGQRHPGGDGLTWPVGLDQPPVVVVLLARSCPGTTRTGSRRRARSRSPVAGLVLTDGVDRPAATHRATVDRGDHVAQAQPAGPRRRSGLDVTTNAPSVVWTPATALGVTDPTSFVRAPRKASRA
jgi:hypothetical protein